MGRNTWGWPPHTSSPSSQAYVGIVKSAEQPSENASVCILNTNMFLELHWPLGVP